MDGVEDPLAFRFKAAPIPGTTRISASTLLTCLDGERV